MGAAVRIHQAVHAEIAVVGKLTVVASIGIHLLAGDGMAFLYGMVTPLPDHAAAGTVILLHDMEIILQISGTVPHGMGIFA